jgi:hypothetical protein
MSTLTLIEKRKLEKRFDMGAGYVLDFSNRTFREFVLDSTGLNVYDPKYDNASGSKANRLRAFWLAESNRIVGKLVSDLLEYSKDRDEGSPERYAEYQQIVQRLLQNVSGEDIEAITPNADGRDFDQLATSVRASIERNEPELGLDRLHTFVVKYVRVLCEKSGIATSREKPLHSLFGEYVKYLRRSGLIESEMSERILKSSISTLEAFNEVRNEHSLAHDNAVLSYRESVLIFNHVASSIRFLRSLDERKCTSVEADTDIPF